MIRMFVLSSLLTLVGCAAPAPPPSIAPGGTAMARLNQPGPEAKLLEARVGLWDVTETVWPAPNAAPVVTTGLVAERFMLGTTLQEMIRPPEDVARHDVKRTDLLTFNRVEGRWQYVSLDTRAPVGLMPAWSAGPGDAKSVALTFAPFAFVGFGDEVTGQLLRMEQTVVFEDADHDTKEQTFAFADGTATKWLAHRYAYSRRAGNRASAIKKRGTLRVAVLDEYPWLVRRGPSYDGAAWLLATEFAKRLGVELETVPVSFADKVSILSAGDRVDITIAPLLETAEREKVVDFIDYSEAAHCVFGVGSNPKLANATALDDLNRADLTIAFIRGTPQGEWIQKRLPKARSLPIGGNLADVALDPILSNRADIAPIDKFFVAGLGKKNPSLVSIPRGAACLASKELPFTIGMAIAKGQPEFLDWLRHVAREVKPLVDERQASIVAAGPP